MITTHLNADFDGLASMVAARKLYPEAVLVFPGGAEAAVRSFLAVHDLGLSRLTDLDLTAVTRLILVDTQEPERLVLLPARTCCAPCMTMSWSRHRSAPRASHGRTRLPCPIVMCSTCCECTCPATAIQCWNGSDRWRMHRGCRRMLSVAVCAICSSASRISTVMWWLRAMALPLPGRWRSRKVPTCTGVNALVRQWSCSQTGARLSGVRLRAETYRMLTGQRLESVLFLLAKTTAQAAQQQIAAYLDTFRYMPLHLSGHDLHAMGLTPGPQFRTILHHLLEARLNGEITTEAEARALVRQLVDNQ